MFIAEWFGLFFFSFLSLSLAESVAFFEIFPGVQELKMIVNST